VAFDVTYGRLDPSTCVITYRTVRKDCASLTDILRTTLDPSACETTSAVGGLGDGCCPEEFGGGSGSGSGGGSGSGSGGSDYVVKYKRYDPATCEVTTRCERMRECGGGPDPGDDYDLTSDCSTEAARFPHTLTVGVGGVTYRDMVGSSTVEGYPLWRAFSDMGASTEVAVPYVEADGYYWFEQTITSGGKTFFLRVEIHLDTCETYLECTYEPGGFHGSEVYGTGASFFFWGVVTGSTPQYYPEPILLETGGPFEVEAGGVGSTPSSVIVYDFDAPPLRSADCLTTALAASLTAVVAGCASGLYGHINGTHTLTYSAGIWLGTGTTSGGFGGTKPFQIGFLFSQFLGESKALAMIDSFVPRTSFLDPPHRNSGHAFAESFFVCGVSFQWDGDDGAGGTVTVTE
jgi:hypothetical protein